jgi:hypothetical protein
MAFFQIVFVKNYDQMFDKVFFVDMLFKRCLEFDCSSIESLFFIISNNYNYIFYIIKNMKQK